MIDLEYENNRFLDVINENDQIVDSKSRTDIHRLGLLHREIHVWMFDENKNIIFQKRGLHRPSAGLLDATIGGHVNQGEDYLDTAVRETKEETGISISRTDLILLKKFTNTSNSSREILGGTTNNFIRSVFIYKKPIKDSKLQKEVGLPGNGFQKLSYEFIMNLKNEYMNMFDKFIVDEELPDVLKFIK